MHTGESSSTKSFRIEVTRNKAILGLFLLSFTMIVSKSAFDRMKQTNIFRSMSTGPIMVGDTSIQQRHFEQRHFDHAVQDLLAELKSATTTALLGSGSTADVGSINDTEVEFSSEDRLKWEATNPCKSREDLKLRYKRRKLVKNVDIPPELNALMQEYTKLHRACIRAYGNLTSLFLSKTSSTRTGCKFVVAEAGNGLGNRIMWMVSNLMYAVLTKRVLLIDSRSRITSLMCEPFLGSSWEAPQEFPFADLRPDLWQSTNEFISTVEAGKMNKEKKNRSEVVVPVNAARADDSWGPVSRFYCPTEQSIYAEVRWIALGGCLYFLPELFAVPAFQPVLESVFKDRIPLTHLVRFAMLPADLIWAKVRRVEEVYLAQADQLVGVHVRYRGGYQDYQSFHEIVNSNVKECLVENKILPRTSPLSSTYGKNKVNVLFIASLYSSLYEDMKGVYPQVISDMNRTGEVVSLVHLSSEGRQYSSLETDGRAFIEILCLSFSDVLLTSPMSTFSEIAHAYGGLQPWIINLHERAAAYGQSKKRHYSSAAACRRGRSIDGCYQGAGVFYVCPYDPEVDNRQIMERVPSLKPCEDGSPGVQFVP